MLLYYFFEIKTNIILSLKLCELYICPKETNSLESIIPFKI